MTTIEIICILGISGLFGFSIYKLLEIKERLKGEINE